MKKNILLLIVLFFPTKLFTNNCSTKNCDSNKECSKSFFVPRSITFDLTYELALTNYDIYHPTAKSGDLVNCYEDQCKFLGIYITPFFQKSTDNNHLASFFFPNCKCSLKIEADGSGDIGSLWLQKDFSSKMSINPQREVAGAHVNVRFDLTRWSKYWRWLENYWFSFAFAFMRAKHDLRLNVTDESIPGSTIEAFNNPNWKHGKLSPCALTVFGVDDLQIKYGRDMYFGCDDQHHGAFYGIITVPTADEPNSRYLFEPVIGTNHPGTGIGFNIDLSVFENESFNLNLMAEAKYRYLYPRYEMRSFDLIKNKDWSRYLLVVSQDDKRNPEPGINHLTQKVLVEPKSQAEAWAAVHFRYCKYNFEIGYNFWWRDRETISLKCPFSCYLGIYDLAAFIECNNAPDCKFTSSSTANISQGSGINRPISDEEFRASCDLKIETAEYPKVITNKIYGAFSYNSAVYQYPCLIGLGGAFEFGSNNATLESWSVWAKLGMNF